MRGSIYYQTSELTKMVFREGAKKIERVNSQHEHYQCVSSFRTMKSYRSIWNNLAIFVKDEFSIKDLEQLSDQHIQHYFQNKLLNDISKQYAEKICSALGKLEIALTRFSRDVSNKNISYDFSIRQAILDQAKKDQILYNGYHKRTYQNPLQIINLLQPLHQLAATIQLESGCRFEGVGLIKRSQLLGISIDPITKKEVGTVITKEKGGKSGEILIALSSYHLLETYFESSRTFSIDYQSYIQDIRNACHSLSINSEGSHGLRWSFAQGRLREYQQAGYTYDEALQGVSTEMKHHRKSITSYYIPF
jgi:hypothetical protein